jgi:hypothetical protein
MLKVIFFFLDCTKYKPTGKVNVNVKVKVKMKQYIIKNECKNKSFFGNVKMN